MIRSMTAYAGNELTTHRMRVELEIRGYNSRHLDISMKLPPGCQFLEEKIRTLISEEVTRGRIELKLSLSSEEEQRETFAINWEIAEGYHEALTRLQKRFNLTEAIPLSLLAAKSGLIEPAKPEIDPEAAWEAVEKALRQGLEALNEMKAHEGRHTAEDMENRLAVIEGHIQSIEERASELLASYQQRLAERIQTLTRGLVEIEPSRIAQEAAFLADKSDISEEISRARSHLDQFRQLMQVPEPAGRPLNFLLQEFNREFTTMGSKAGNADIAHIIVSAKTELEKIREQVQNIE